MRLGMRTLGNPTDFPRFTAMRMTTPRDASGNSAREERVVFVVVVSPFGVGAARDGSKAACACRRSARCGLNQRD